MTKDELIKKRISAISLGCDKNRVDLEKMLYSLKNDGFEIVEDVEDAEIVIINTCAFILPAKQEAISNIVEMEFLKRKNNIEKIVVTGCFNERNFDELVANFPDVDAFVRLKDNDNIANIIKDLYNIENTATKNSVKRVLTTPNSYAYLKIADGCDNACSYCTIPRIRGRYKSATIEKILEEAEFLVDFGVKEIILVAQDVTSYGEDLYKENKLLDLCKKLVKIKGLQWLRLHYLYPEKLTDELLQFIAENEKVCKYIDVPLQHIDNQVLINMRRRLDEEGTRELIGKIKTNYPQITIRTTFIIGFPGETRRAFAKLCKFVKESCFDCAGFFEYSKEENTAAYFMKNHILKFIKKNRVKKVQKIQRDVIIKKSKDKIGKNVCALIDGFDENTGLYFAHEQGFSPNVDFGLLVEVDNAAVGNIVDVEIQDFDGENYKGVKL